jgi:hypothetical protein
MPPKLWHWDYFQTRAQDHPKGTRKDYHGKNNTFVNAWCRACVLGRISALSRDDDDAKARGLITIGRSQTELLEQGERKTTAIWFLLCTDIY